MYGGFRDRQSVVFGVELTDADGHVGCQ